MVLEWIFAVAVLLDLQQRAGVLKELFALGRLLGVRVEGSLAAVAQIGASLALDGRIYGSEDNGA